MARLAEGQKSFDPAPAKHKAEKGDLVIMDFEGKVDGEPFEGGKGEGMSVELGSGRLIPGFEDQLVGAKANDQLDGQASPSRPITMSIISRAAPRPSTSSSTRSRSPRAMKADDDFAKSMGLEGIGQLRDLLKGQVEQELNGLTRTHMKRQLLDQLAAAHDFPVPESMVEAEFDQIWQQLEHEASHEADPAAARAEMEKERDDYRAIAERRVRLGLLLSEIGQKNGVQISQQEMNQLIMQAAQQYRPEDRQKFVEYVRNEPMAAAQLRAPLFEDKVVDHLFATRRDRRARGRPARSWRRRSNPRTGHVHGPGCGHDHGEPSAKAKKAAAKKPAAKKEAAPAKAAGRQAGEEGSGEESPAKKA